MTSDPTTISVTLGSGIGPGDQVTMQYSRGDVIDLNGVPVASLTGVSIINATPAAQASFVSASVNGTTLTVKYSAAVAGAVRQ